MIKQLETLPINGIMVMPSNRKKVCRCCSEHIDVKESCMLFNKYATNLKQDFYMCKSCMKFLGECADVEPVHKDYVFKEYQYKNDYGTFCEDSGIPRYEEYSVQMFQMKYDD